jgi:hypothetical protein
MWTTRYIQTDVINTYGYREQVITHGVE